MPRFEVVPATLNVRSGPGTNFEILDTLTAGDVVEELSAEGWCPIPMEDGSVGWLARKYLTAAALEAPAPVVPAGGEPVWIQWARKQIGQKEVPGPGDNPVIAAWYHLTTLDPSMWHDITAWCAVFVNAAFMLNNIKTIRSARAVDWLGFGIKVEIPQKGDVVVFDWGGGSHHVAFFLRDLGNGRIECIGGNQSDAVTITSFPESAVMGYRRAA
jgi:uncharacterized protein (TIGR02594 family)